MGNGLSVTKNGKLFYMEVQFVYRIIYRLSLKAPNISTILSNIGMYLWANLDYKVAQNGKTFNISETYISI